MTITPTPEINYLVLTIGGAVLYFVGVESERPGVLEVVVTAVGVLFFTIGMGRAFMGAFGL